jgi:hypothetical protein
MKKINLVEVIQSFLASDAAGDQKGMYHVEEIKVWMNAVFGDIIYNAWKNGNKFSDFSQLDAWSKPYVCAVVGQTGTKAHVLLPFAPVNLPNGLGVQSVYDHNDSSVMFAPIESDAQIIFAELEVDTMDSTPTYVLQQNNLSTGEGEASHMLLLDKLPVAPLTLITEIDAMLITPFDVIGDYDDISLPENGENNMMRAVLDVMSKKPIPDISADGVIRPQNQ